MGMDRDMKENRERRREMAMECYISSQEDIIRENGGKTGWKAKALSITPTISKPMSEDGRMTSSKEKECFIMRK